MSEDSDAEPESEPFDQLEPQDADGDTDPFTEMDVEVGDEEAVWDALDEDEDESTDLDAVGPADIDVETQPQEAIVPKQTYCERCEHFSEPPDIGCESEGTEIRELVDMEHFRVYDCPIVEKRRGLGTYEE